MQESAARADDTPDVPWMTAEGIGWRELRDQAGGLLAAMRAILHHGNPADNPVALTLLADHAGELRDLLRALAQSELAVMEIYNAGRRDQALRGGQHRHLRLAPSPGSA